MAISSKDFETLWQRYTVEAVPAGISVNQFFESNECQMYFQKFDKNMSFVRLEFEGIAPVYVLEWKYLVAI